jgi:hypothetical protein
MISILISGGVYPRQRILGKKLAKTNKYMIIDRKFKCLIRPLKYPYILMNVL